jgi:hypothetical protein
MPRLIHVKVICDFVDLLLVAAPSKSNKAPSLRLAYFTATAHLALTR